MATDPVVRELLLRWEELRRQGSEASVDELCRDRPDLAASLRREVEALESLDHMLASNPRSEKTDLQLQTGSEPVPGYRLEKQLGRGGFGEVWRAVGPGGFPVALKFVQLGERGADSEVRSLEIFKAIRHPNLLATFGAWRVGGHLVIALELADRTLYDRFREAKNQGHTGIPREELLDYLREAAKGIDFLNEPRHQLGGPQPVGVQHRDLKPQNILLVGDGVKVADFGLARLLGQKSTGHSGGMTPSFAAPEFFRGKTSRHSDQYCLGVTYCMLRAGQLPFTGSPETVMFGHLEEAPDLSYLPEAERPIVARALAKNPDERWPSCRAFAQALARVEPDLHDQPTGPYVPAHSGDSLTPTTTTASLPSGVSNRAPPAPNWRAPASTGGGRASRRVVLALLILTALVTAAAVLVLVLPGILRQQDRGNDVVAQRVPPPEPPAQPPVADPDPVKKVVLDRQPPEDKASPPIVPDPHPAPVKPPPTKPAEPPPEVDPKPKANPAKPKAEPGAAKPPEPAPAVADELRCLRGHKDDVLCLAIDPSGHAVFSGGKDGTVRRWQLDTGMGTVAFAGHKASVNCVAISADGQLGLSGDDDRKAYIWQLASGDRQAPPLVHENEVYAAAFLDNGQRCLTAGNDQIVRLWDVATGAKRQGFESQFDSIFTVVPLPGSTQALLAGRPGTIEVIDLASGKTVRRLEGQRQVTWSLAISEDGQRAISGGGDTDDKDFAPRLWDCKGGKELKRLLPAHAWSVGAVALTPDGQLALSGDSEGNIRLWDVATSRELHRFVGHKGKITGLAFAAGRRAVSCGGDGTVRVWALPR
jgi:WD40 repeat protein/serine/threonine protein kinase